MISGALPRVALMLFFCAFLAAEFLTIKLPEPKITGGMPLMEALSVRQSLREFSEKPLPDNVLSDLLWASFGVNRPESGKRTAPSARNWQEVDIYVAKAEGLYLYNAQENTLEPIIQEDIREYVGRQGFTSEAPVGLIFVVNRDVFGDIDEEAKDFYSAIDTGYISQNTYLYCASKGLATVVLGMVDRDVLAEKMKLNENQRIVVTQPVGYPK